MEKAENNLNNNINKQDSNQIPEQIHDAHEQSIDDKIEAMLKLNWVMLPESCSIPCRINLLIYSL